MWLRHQKTTSCHWTSALKILALYGICFWDLRVFNSSAKSSCRTKFQILTLAFSLFALRIFYFCQYCFIQHPLHKQHCILWTTEYAKSVLLNNHFNFFILSFGDWCGSILLFIAKAWVALLRASTRWLRQPGWFSKPTDSHEFLNIDCFCTNVRGILKTAHKLWRRRLNVNFFD